MIVAAEILDVRDADAASALYERITSTCDWATLAAFDRLVQLGRPIPQGINLWRFDAEGRSIA